MAGYHLRWFTPGTEVELCGHATLASAFVMLNYYDKDSDKIEFNTLSGELTVVRIEGRIQISGEAVLFAVAEIQE